MFSILGLLLLCSANDLLTVYLGMELQSLSFYLLAAFRKKSSYSVDAGLKYFILGSFSSSLFLFGSSFIYVAYGSINFDDIKLLSDFFSVDSSCMYDEKTYLSEEELNVYLSKSLDNEASYALLLTQAKKLQPSIAIDTTVLIRDIILPDFFKYCDNFITSGQICPTSTDERIIDVMHELKTKMFGTWVFFDGPYCLQPYDKYFTESINLPKRPADICGCYSSVRVDDTSIENVRDFINTVEKCMNKTEILPWSNNVGRISRFGAREQLFHIIFMYLEKLKYINHDIVNDTIIHNRNLKLESMGAFKQENMFEFQYFAIVGLLLIFFSLFFKLSLAPFHLWSPDVYENSPTSSSFFFAVVPKISIFVVLVRLVYSSFFFAFNWIQELLLLIAVFSVIAGSLGGLYQRKLKSLLAYSSISHMGYLMIAFSSASIEGIQMLFCYLIVYTITGLCLWSIVILIRLKKKDKIKQNKDLADLALLIKSNYMLALILMSTLFSIAGIPPLIGFIAKVNIFLVAIENKFYVVSIISVLFSVVSTFFYLRLIKIMCFEPLLVGRLYYPINSSKVFIIVLLFFSLFLFFIDPTLLYLLAYKISYLFL